MTSQLSTKIAAWGAALMVNGAMIGGIAFLFGGHLHQGLTSISSAEASLSAPVGLASAPQAATG